MTGHGAGAGNRGYRPRGTKGAARASNGSPRKSCAVKPRGTNGASQRIQPVAWGLHKRKKRVGDWVKRQSPQSLEIAHSCVARRVHVAPIPCKRGHGSPKQPSHLCICLLCNKHCARGVRNKRIWARKLSRASCAIRKPGHPSARSSAQRPPRSHIAHSVAAKVRHPHPPAAQGVARKASIPHKSSHAKRPVDRPRDARHARHDNRQSNGAKRAHSKCSAIAHVNSLQRGARSRHGRGGDGG